MIVSLDIADNKASENASHADTHAQNPWWYVTITTTALTVANLLSPASFVGAGWIAGSFFWVISILLSWVSGHLIGYCAIDARQRGLPCTYPDIMKDAFGTPGYVFAASAQLVTYFLNNSTLILVLADLFTLITQGAGVCTWMTILITAGILSLLAQVRTFREVTPLAVLSLVAQAGFMIAVWAAIGEHSLLSSCKPTYGSPTLLGSLNSLSTIALLFGGHGVLPEEIREMAEPDRFPLALNVSYVGIVIMYAVFAPVGYAVWGDFTNGDVTQNLPDVPARRAAALLAFLVIMVTTTISHVLYVGLVEELVGLSTARTGLGQLAREVARIVLRTALVWMEATITLMLHSAGIESFTTITGALGFAALTYYAPYAAYWKLIARRDSHSTLRQALLLAGFLVGLFISIAGTSAAVYDFIDGASEYILFDMSCNPPLELDVTENPCRIAYFGLL